MKRILLLIALLAVAVPIQAQEGVCSEIVSLRNKTCPAGTSCTNKASTLTWAELDGDLANIAELCNLSASPVVTAGSDGDSSTVESDSGLELIGDLLTLLRGCSDNQAMIWDETEDDWNCETVSSGDVAKVGTPVNDQVGIWTGDGTIEGDTGLTYDGTDLTAAGDVNVGDDLTVSGATATGTIEDTNTVAVFQLRNSVATPAADVEAGKINFQAEDDGTNITTYAQVIGLVTDDTDTSEDGYGAWAVAVAGSLTEILRVNGAGATVTGAMVATTGTDSTVKSVCTDVPCDSRVVVETDAQVWHLRSVATIKDFIVQDITLGEVPFRIESGATQDTLVVDAASRVGIGTATPSVELDVVGAANVSGALTLGTVLAVAEGGTGAGTLADLITEAEIADDAVQEEHLKAVDAAVDEECLTYEATTGDFEWQACGAGGSGAFSDAGDPVVLNTTTKDVSIGTTHNNTAKLSVDGDADQVQASIQGNATQTSSILVVEQSDGTDLLTQANTGAFTIIGPTLTTDIFTIFGGYNPAGDEGSADFKMCDNSGAGSGGCLLMGFGTDEEEGFLGAEDSLGNSCPTLKFSAETGNVSLVDDATCGTGSGNAPQLVGQVDADDTTTVQPNKNDANTGIGAESGRLEFYVGTTGDATENFAVLNSQIGMTGTGLQIRAPSGEPSSAAPSNKAVCWWDDTSKDLECVGDVDSTPYTMLNTRNAATVPSITVGTLTDPADAGAVRLDNAALIAWEASPAGTDVTMAADANEIIQITGGTLDGADLTTASVTATQIEATPALTGTNFTGIPSSALTTIVMSVPINAGGAVADATQCAAPAQVTVNSVPMYTIICTDNDSSSIYFDFALPDSYDGGTFVVKSHYIQTAADTNVLNGDMSAFCRDAGESGNTYGSEVAMDDAAVTGTNGEDEIVSAAVTGTGCSAGESRAYFRYQMDATGTTTAVATLHFTSFLVEYTSNVGD